MSVRAFPAFSAFSALTGFQTLSHQIKVRRSRVIDASWPLPQKKLHYCHEEDWGAGLLDVMDTGRGLSSPVTAVSFCFLTNARSESDQSGKSLQIARLMAAWLLHPQSDLLSEPSPAAAVRMCLNSVNRICIPPHQILPSAASEFILVDEFFTRWIASCSIDMAAALIAMAV